MYARGSTTVLHKLFVLLQLVVRSRTGNTSNYCLSNSSETSTYESVPSLEDRGFSWRLNPPGVYFCLCLAFSLAWRTLSPVSINSSAALSPLLLALPSQCPTPPSFPSVCTDPWGPRLPPRARHNPPSIDISAGLRWRAERVSQKGDAPSYTTENILGMEWETVAGNERSVVLHVLAHCLQIGHIIHQWLSSRHFTHCSYDYCISCKCRQLEDDVLLLVCIMAWNTFRA